MQKDGSHVLSTPLRLDADERFTGKGSRSHFSIPAFIRTSNSRPDKQDRCVSHLLDTDGDTSTLNKPYVASWHGMMTSVVAAGQRFALERLLTAASRPMQMWSWSSLHEQAGSRTRTTGRVGRVLKNRERSTFASSTSRPA